MRRKLIDSDIFSDIFFFSLFFSCTWGFLLLSCCCFSLSLEALDWLQLAVRCGSGILILLNCWLLLGTLNALNSSCCLHSFFFLLQLRLSRKDIFPWVVLANHSSSQTYPNTCGQEVMYSLYSRIYLDFFLRSSETEKNSMLFLCFGT